MEDFFIFEKVNNYYKRLFIHSIFYRDAGYK